MKSTCYISVCISILWKYLLVVIFSISATSIKAQNPFWDNNLCTSDVVSVAREGNEYWLTTWGGGLIKFNPTTPGTVFLNRKNSDIPSVCLSSIVIDSNGYKWIGTNDGTTGLIRFDGNNNWTCFNNLNTPLLSNVIRCLKVSGNDLWIGTTLGLAKFDGLNWTIYDSATYLGITYPIKQVLDITVDSSGTVWICCPTVGLLNFNGNKWTVYNNSNSGLQCGIYNSIFSITIDTAGKYLVGHDNGFTSFDGTNWTLYSSNPPQRIHCIRSSSNGEIFMKEFFGGLYKWNGTSWQFITYGSPATFFFQGTHWMRYSFYIDDYNNVWMGNLFGLVKYDSIITDYAPLLKSELSIEGIRDGIYLPSIQNIITCSGNDASGGRGNGITMYDMNVWTYQDVIETCTQNNNSFCVEGSPGSIWMGIRNGVCHFDGNTYTNLYYSTCTVSERTSAIAEYSHGIYAGTSRIGNYYTGRLLKYNGIYWANITTPLTGDTNAHISSLKFWGTSLLIGSHSGLINYDTVNGTIQYTAQNSGIPSDSIHDILIDKSNNFIWLATENGLVKTDYTNWTIYNTTNSAIPENIVRCVTQDSLGNVWIGTASKGIALFDGTNFTNYDTHNSGLSDDRINSIFVGPNNEIWVGTYQGGLPVFHYGTWLSANNGTVIHPSFTKNGIKIIPNPTHGITNITLNFTETGRAAAFIYNTLGQKVKTLFDEDIITPEFAVNWDGRDDAGNALTAGVYFCSLKTANNLVTKRIILIPQ